MTLAQALNAMGMNSTFAALIATFDQFGSEVYDSALYDEGELPTSYCYDAGDFEELRTAVADRLEGLLESARSKDAIANEAVDKLVFDYVHMFQRERFHKRGRVFDTVDSVDGPWGRKRARFLQQPRRSVLKTCPLDLCYYKSISDKELTLLIGPVHHIFIHSTKHLDLWHNCKFGGIIRCDRCNEKMQETTVHLTPDFEWFCQACR